MLYNDKGVNFLKRHDNALEHQMPEAKTGRTARRKVIRYHSWRPQYPSISNEQIQQEENHNSTAPLLS